MPDLWHSGEHSVGFREDSFRSFNGFTDVVKSVPLNMKYMAYTLSIGLKSCLELESVPQSGRPHEFGISQLLSQQ